MTCFAGGIKLVASLIVGGDSLRDFHVVLV